MNAAAIPISAARKTGLFLDAIRFQESNIRPTIRIYRHDSRGVERIGRRDLASTLHQFIWITVAMVGARTVGMAVNRIIDRYIDAQNPRNAGRHLPSGKLSLRDMMILTIAGARRLRLRRIPAEPHSR